MNTFKKIVVATALVLFTVTPSWADKTVKLDLNAVYGSTSFHTMGAMDFAKRAGDYSNGTLDITVHPGGSLGFKGPELLKSVNDAQLPMSDILMGVVAGSEHVFGVSSLPRLATSFAEARALYDDCKPLYEKAAAKWNQKMLYAAPWPPSGLVTKNRVASADDIAGLKTRTYDKNGANFLRELGGAPVSLPWGEVYSSLRTGMIDSVLTSAESTKNGKFWEVLGHFTNIYYAFPLNMVTINLDYWNSLSGEQQQAMIKAAKDTEASQWKNSEAKTTEAIKVIRENGFVISDPTSALSEEMDRAAAVIVEEYAGDADKATRTVLDKYLK
ncbi:MAG TPA: TRAP transporter substrate-binding protein [Desulfobacteraceae bacterium]|nr:TRAP transporter substrate-binding protein [Desulfobacteraceae bacterium]